ncbi:dual specificity phosphatase 5, isoform CRA_a [Rattus norvegicus]|uniref:Dual specificity phosphatase 5, isoform CRA_a n=1 Tax=Rattus norvegicus TaxID=10116 RepID=A6JHW0_RAT|nr:dual specificity phosphatase 5, isoform CRA_a [Rattus norvegicus]
MKVTSLDGRRLRKMLRKEAEARCVVLDCRPYLAFAASSVRGSLNVNLNSVVLRRARGGAVSARYVLPDEAARARLLQEGGGGVAAVVVLDQGSRHWQKLREESAARVVLTSLLACLPAGPRVYFLKGVWMRSPFHKRSSKVREASSASAESPFSASPTDQLMTRVAQLKSFPSSTLEVPTMHPSASSSPTCTSQPC